MATKPHEEGGDRHGRKRERDTDSSGGEREVRRKTELPMENLSIGADDIDNMMSDKEDKEKKKKKSKKKKSQKKKKKKEF